MTDKSTADKIAAKRVASAKRNEALAAFRAKWGEGHNDLENFLLEVDRLGNLAEADPTDMEWLFEHVVKIATAVRSYISHESRTLDEAFRVHRPSGYRQPAARKRYMHRRSVQFHGRVLKSAGAVVDQAFFEVLADIVGVNKTLASEWYYEVTLPPFKQVDDLPPALEKYRSRLNWKR